jgi:hypothetical protein
MRQTNLPGPHALESVFDKLGEPRPILAGEIRDQEDLGYAGFPTSLTYIEIRQVTGFLSYT